MGRAREMFQSLSSGLAVFDATLGANPSPQTCSCALGGGVLIPGCSRCKWLCVARDLGTRVLRLWQRPERVPHGTAVACGGNRPSFMWPVQGCCSALVCHVCVTQGVCRHRVYVIPVVYDVCSSCLEPAQCPGFRRGFWMHRVMWCECVGASC